MRQVSGFSPGRPDPLHRPGGRGDVRFAVRRGTRGSRRRGSGLRAGMRGPSALRLALPSRPAATQRLDRGAGHVDFGRRVALDLPGPAAVVAAAAIEPVGGAPGSPPAPPAPAIGARARIAKIVSLTPPLTARHVGEGAVVELRGRGFLPTRSMPAKSCGSVPAALTTISSRSNAVVQDRSASAVSSSSPAGSG